MVAKEKEVEERAAEEKEVEEATEEDYNSPAITISELPETDFAHIKDNKANGVFSLPLLTKFIYKVSRHAVECESPVNLDAVDKRFSAAIIEHWKCLKCMQALEQRNCQWVKTDFVEPGRKDAYPQPELNLRIIKGDHPLGINLEKVQKFMSGTLAINIPDY